VRNTNLSRQNVNNEKKFYKIDTRNNSVDDEEKKFYKIDTRNNSVECLTGKKTGEDGDRFGGGFWNGVQDEIHLKLLSVSMFTIDWLLLVLKQLCVW